jgi:hypothetical protein
VRYATILRCHCRSPSGAEVTETFMEQGVNVVKKTLETRVAAG